MKVHYFSKNVFKKILIVAGVIILASIAIFVFLKTTARPKEIFRKIEGNMPRPAILLINSDVNAYAEERSQISYMNIAKHSRFKKIHYMKDSWTNAIALSPDGARIFTGSEGGIIEIAAKDFKFIRKISLKDFKLKNSRFLRFLHASNKYLWFAVEQNKKSVVYKWDYNNSPDKCQKTRFLREDNFSALIPHDDPFWDEFRRKSPPLLNGEVYINIAFFFHKPMLVPACNYYTDDNINYSERYGWLFSSACPESHRTAPKGRSYQICWFNKKDVLIDLCKGALATWSYNGDVYFIENGGDLYRKSLDKKEKELVFRISSHVSRYYRYMHSDLIVSENGEFLAYRYDLKERNIGYSSFIPSEIAIFDLKKEVYKVIDCKTRVSDVSWCIEPVVANSPKSKTSPELKQDTVGVQRKPDSGKITK